jgi:membrane protein DedA with SNARE-associated domain
MILSAVFGVSIINLIILFIVVYVCAFGFSGGMIWLVASGAAANTPSELALIIAVGASAAILGDFSAFLLARKFSFKLQRWLKKFRFYRENEKRVKSSFNKSEFFILFFSRFLVQEICAAAIYISGFLRLKKVKFFAAIVPGEIIYASGFPLLGFFFKETWKDYTNVLGDVFTLLFLAVIAFFLVRWAIRYYKRRDKIRGKKRIHNKITKKT